MVFKCGVVPFAFIALHFFFSNTLWDADSRQQVWPSGLCTLGPNPKDLGSSPAGLTIAASAAPVRASALVRAPPLALFTNGVRVRGGY